jgi:hypothetical protein
MFAFLAEKGVLSPAIMALALIVVVAFQSGIDARQETAIADMQVQLKVITGHQVEVATLVSNTTKTLERIDDLGTKSELTHRLAEIDRREAEERAVLKRK